MISESTWGTIKNRHEVCSLSSSSTHKMTLLMAGMVFRSLLPPLIFSRLSNCLRLNRVRQRCCRGMQIVEVCRPFRVAIECSRKLPWLNDLRKQMKSKKRFALCGRRRQKSSKRDARLCSTQSVLTLFASRPLCPRRINKFAWLICEVESLICKMFVSNVSYFSFFG